MVPWFVVAGLVSATGTTGIPRVGFGSRGRPLGNRWPYREENFFRLDRSDDKEFYAEPRSDTEDNGWVRVPSKHGVL